MAFFIKKENICCTFNIYTANGTGVEDMTLHQLRHCNAIMLLNSGIDLKVVSEQLGHCDVNVTADIYADVLRKTKARTAEQIELCLA